MKKYKIAIFIFTILIIILLIFFLYKKTNTSDGKNTEEKSLAEVEFLEGRLETLLNEMNNIDVRNYNVSVNEIDTKNVEKERETTESKTSEDSIDKSSSTSNNENQNKSSGSSSNRNSNNSTDSSSGKNQNNKSKNSKTDESKNSDNSNLDLIQNEEFKLESTSILLENNQINWKKIKIETEKLYLTIPTITLDLYQIGVEKEDVLNFNKRMDELTIAVENEDKTKSLEKLANIYEYISKFFEKSSNDNLKKVVVQTKSKIFNAYSLLDADDWSVINDNINQAIDIFSSMLRDVDISSSKQYTINKIYVMLNELKNAVEIKDKNVFLIKYKNTLEEMSDL